MESTTVVPDESSGRRRMQFSIRAMLLVPLFTVIFIGLAVVVDLYAFHVCHQLFGNRWMGNAMSWLIDVGVSTGFVEGYLGIAMVDLPGLIVLATTTLILGLRRSRSAHFLAWILTLAYPLQDLFGSRVLNEQIVAAFAIVVGISAWFVGWSIRGRFHDLAIERQPTWISRALQVLLWTFVVMASTYGWHLLTTYY